MFHFKRFSVDDSCSAMKVGTDGVLLGAWCSADDVVAVAEGGGVGRILDVGGGSGLISLMVAQRSECGGAAGAGGGGFCVVDCVEIDEASASQAKANVETSVWGDRVFVHCVDFQSFVPTEKYDLIVSNPPFFEESLLPPNAERGVARHTTELTFEELVGGVVRLLNVGGRFAVILPVAESGRVDDIVRADGRLRLVRRCGVRNSADKPLKRYMSEYILSDEAAAVEEDLLYVREGVPLEYSAAYRALTADFYLKF